MDVEVRVPAARLDRWLANFSERHGQTRLSASGGALVGEAADGSMFRAEAPFGRSVGRADPGELVRACVPPARWGILLVRKGGFAVARLEQDSMVEHKVGQRHVQGRTKAGGQSQQRFARRRDNQARVAYEAAAGHAARILAGVTTVVLGGDDAALHEVLADRRLSHVVPAGRRLAVPDPRRAVLDQAVRDACSVTMSVQNTD